MLPSLSTLQASASLSDEDLLIEMKSLLPSPTVKNTEILKSIAEAEFTKIHDQNKKEAEKKAYINKQYGQEICLLFMLEECRMYIAFIRIIEQNLEEVLIQQAESDKVKYDESIRLLQNRFQDIYRAQVKPIVLNQEKEQLLSKVVSQIAEVQTKIEEMTLKRERRWGAPTWEEGIKNHATAAIQAIKQIDPLVGIPVPPEKIDAAKSQFEKMYEVLEERLAKRLAFSELQKLVGDSHKNQQKNASTSVVVSADAPMAPTLDKLYAPTNQQIKTQYEVDTEVLLASNARNTYQSVFKNVAQLKSFTQMGVELAKKQFAGLKAYTNAINHFAEDSVVIENLSHLKSNLTHMRFEMNLDLDSPRKPRPGR